MTTNFGETMKTQLEAYLKAASEEAEGTTTRKKTGKAAVEYECEVSGIDMIISRVVNGKCTMKLFIFLSQPDPLENGTMFIKTMKDGTMKEATDENLATFLRDVGGTIQTTSNVIPYIKSGKGFAELLIRAKNSTFIELAKEGLINTAILDDNHTSPWYFNKWSYRGMGEGIEDKHAKLIRHAITKMAERYGETYGAVLAAACSDYNYRYDGTYDDKRKYKSVWAFSVLADIFDEPYAIRCFDEYLDNDRLGGLYYNQITDLFKSLCPRENPYQYLEWTEAVRMIRIGNAKVNLDKNRFWEFLQHAVAVGLGTNLSNYISQYSDYLRQALFCDGKVKDKYPEYLQVAHDVYSEKYRLIKEFRDTQRLRERAAEGRTIIDQVHDGYQLRTLGEVNEFLEEARQNCNCVASYVENVKKGSCWIASFRKLGADSTQLTVEVDPEGELVQIRGKFNRMPTAEENSILEKFRAGIRSRMKKNKEATA